MMQTEVHAQNTQTNAPTLKVEDISISFGGLKAVNDLSFTIPEKSITSVIGPNGAGKTTFFNIATGIYTPTSGWIELYGDRLTGHTPDEIVGMGICRTFQNIRLFSELTVLENVLIGEHIHYKASLWDILLKTKRFKQEEQELFMQAVELLRYVGLLPHANELAKNLSYGAQRRLEIARALATRPKFLFLDEPTAGMNPTESVEMIDLFRRICDERNIGILLIEHDMKVVMDVSEKIVVLNFGEKIAEGTPQEIQNNEEVVTAYLGRSKQ